MGNNQSQASDDEGNPRYNYHENVLREAQSDIANNSVNPASDDEQYYSAEEGDSVRSITPQRTRPESSSAEDISDSEDNDLDDDDPERGQTNVAENSVSQNPAVANTSGRTNIRSQRSCGQCNVSTYQEQDSIAAELEEARRISGNSFIISIDNNEQSQVLSSSNRDLSTAQTTAEHSSPGAGISPFIPIQPAEVSVRSRELSPVSSKRKVERGSESPRGDYVWPKKRMTTRGDSKRKRLGYPESSDSGENEVNRKQHKKGKLSCSSSKKDRRKYRDGGSRHSDSDEKRYGKKSRTRCSRQDKSNDSDSEKSDREKAGGRRKETNKNKRSHKNSRKRSSDYSSDNSSEDRSVRRRSDRQQNSESDTAEEGNERSLRNVSQRFQKDGDHPLHRGLQVQERNKSVPSLNENLGFSLLCNTTKMGKQSMRNLKGKVFPLRQQSQSTNQINIQENGPSSQRADSGHTGQPYMAAHLQPVNSAFVVPHTLGLKRIAASHLEMHDGGDSFSHMTSNSKGDEARRVQQHSNQAAQENVNTSPFKNVVLIPPKTTDFYVSQSPIIINEGKTVEDTVKENCSDMEVDESEIYLQTHLTPTAFSSFQSQRSRVLLQGKRINKTARDRFRNFWSEKKKNISSNLKSLFGKVKPHAEKSLDTSNLAYQSQVTAVSADKSGSPYQNNHSSVHAVSSVTNLSSGGIFSVALPSLSQNLSSGIHSLSPHTSVSPIEVPAASQSTHSNRILNSSAHLLGSCSREQMSGRVFNNKVFRCENQQSPSTCSTYLTRVSPYLKSGTASSNQRESEEMKAGGADIEHLPQTSRFQVLHCHLGGAFNLSITMGDIADQNTTGLVNWTDGALTHQVTACSRSVAAKAGALMRAGCNDYIENKGGELEAPDVITTPAGGRFCERVETILHVVAPKWVEGKEDQNSHALTEVYANCLRFADERLRMSSLSFPLIGDRIFPFDLCVYAFFDAVLIFLAEQAASPQDISLVNIQLVIPDASSTDFAAELIQSRLKLIESEGLENIVSQTYSSYAGRNCWHIDQNMAHVDRAASGRPKIKRPRL